MALPKQPVTIPITGGLDTATGPLVIAPGSFLRLDDVRQERANEWRNRQGITHADALDDLSAPPLRTAELPGGGLFGLTAGAANANAGVAWSRNVPATASRWTNLGTGCSQVRPTNWVRHPIATEIQPVYLSTQAVGNGLRLVAWKPGNATVGQDQIRATIVSQADGKTLTPITSLGSTAAASPVAVYMDAAKLFLLFYADGANLHAAKWNANTGAFISDTVIKINVAAVSQFIDALYYTGTDVTVIYRNNAGNVHQLEVTPATLVLTADVNLGVQCDGTLQLFSDPDASGTRLIGVSNVIPEVRVLRTSAAAAILTNDLMAAVTASNIAGVAYQAGAGFQIVWDNSANNAMYAAKKRSGAVGAITQLTPIYGIGTVYKLDSNAWRDQSSDAMRYMIGLHIGTFGTAGDFQNTYYEMALPFETGASGISDRYTEAQARLLPLNAGLPIVGFNALPQVVTTSANNFSLPLKRLATAQLSAGLSANRYAIDVWDERVIAPGDIVNVGPGVPGSQAGYLPAGQLMQSVNGSTILSHGGAAFPFKPTVSLVAFVGGLTVGQAYQYVITIDHQDESGNVWRSDRSIASNPISPTAGNTQVDVVVNLGSIENHNRQRTVKIWRVLGNGSVYQLVHQRTRFTDIAACQFTFSDQVPDTTLASSNFLPVGLPATITPAFNHIAFFDGRMWGAERDFPNRLRFTRTINKGVSPEFPGEFAKDIEDEEGDITGIAACDDKLIVFKETAIYAIATGGPNDDGSGSQYTVVKVSSEFGHTTGAPYLSIGSEVWFFHDGPKRISRQLEIQDVGIPIARYFNQPLMVTPETPVSLTHNHRRDEMRLLTGNYRFVFDQKHAVWIRDTGGAFTGTLYMQRVSDVGDLFFMDSGQVWWDYDTEAIGSSVDASGPLQGLIRAPWMRGNIEGYIRLWKVRALYARDPAAASTVWPKTRVYFNEDDAIFEDDSPLGTTGATKQTVETRTKKMKCSAFSPQITLPSGDLRWRLNGWAVLLGIKKSLHAFRPASLGRPAVTTPFTPTLRYWFESDLGLTVNASNQVTDWVDQTGNGWDLHTPSGGNTPPTVVPNSLNGRQGLYFGNALVGADWSLVHYGGPFYVGPPAAFPPGTTYPFTVNEAHIVYAVVKPIVGAPPGGGVAGGMISTDRKDFARQLWTLSGVQQRLARGPTPVILYENPSIDYTNVPLLIMYRWTGANMFITVNGVTAATTDLISGLPSSAFAPVPDDVNGHVLMVGGSSVDQSGFQGQIYAVMLAADTTPNAQTLAYLSAKWGV